MTLDFAFADRCLFEHQEKKLRSPAVAAPGRNPLRTGALGTRAGAAAPPCPAQPRRPGSEPLGHSGALRRGSRRNHPAPHPHTPRPTHHGKEPYSSRRKTLWEFAFPERKGRAARVPIGYGARRAELRMGLGPASSGCLSLFKKWAGRSGSEPDSAPGK